MSLTAMTRTWTFSLGCACLMVPAVRADEPFVWPESPTSPGVAYLSKNDASGESSITDPAHWSNNPEPISSAYDYWVPAGRVIRWPSSGTTFAGRSLTIEGRTEGSIQTMVFPHLRLKNGGYILQHAAGDMLGSGTEVTIDATAANPAGFVYNRSAGSSLQQRNFLYGCRLVGDADAVFEVRHDQSGGIANAVRLGKTDATNYLGTIRLCRSDASYTSHPEQIFSNIVYNVSLDLPGTLAVGRGTLLRHDTDAKTAKVGTFSLEAGGIYCPCAFAGNLTVSNRLNIADGGFIDTADLRAKSDYTVGPDKFNAPDAVLISLTNAAARTESLPAFDNIVFTNFASRGCNFWGPDPLAFRIDEEGVSGALVYRAGRPVNKSLGQHGGSGNPSVTSNELWDAGHAPRGDENAAIGHVYQLDPKSDLDADNNWTFTGGGMVLVKSGVLRAQAKTVTVTNLFAGGSGEAVIECNSSTDMGGRYATWQNMDHATIVRSAYLGCEYSLSLQVAQHRDIVLDAPIYGNGQLRASTRGSTSYPYGAIELTHQNTNFHGKFIIASDNDGHLDSTRGYRLQFWLNHAYNVGGDMETFTPDGLRLRGDSLLLCRNSVNFNQKNRGIYVQDRIRVVMRNAESNVFAVNTPVTYGGEFVFGNDYPTAPQANVGTGSGTLELGGAALPGEGEGANKLTMLIGTLKPTVTNALDGLTVTLGAECDGLAIDVNASDEMKAHGFIFTKDGSSIVNERKGGKIPVRIDGLPELPEKGDIYTNTVCTVASKKAADSFAASLLAEKLPVGRVSFNVVEQTDGTAQVVAVVDRIVKKATVILFR